MNILFHTRKKYIFIPIIIIIIIIIIVIVGATGTISKSFRKYVSDIPGNNEVRELQKTAILGTAHILRKVLT
jgi:flagellar basal body-associated protein FliL